MDAEAFYHDLFFFFAGKYSHLEVDISAAVS